MAVGGHGFNLQPSISVRLPKHVPPLLSLMILNLDLDFVPSPELFEHDENLVHVDKVQFSENNMIHHEQFNKSGIQFCITQKRCNGVCFGAFSNW